MSRMVVNAQPGVCRSATGLKKRSMVKCDECRRRRIKCTPTRRIWPAQRCHSCIENNMPCGPNIKKTEARQLSSTQLPLPGLAEDYTAISSWSIDNDLEMMTEPANVDVEFKNFYRTVDEASLEYYTSGYLSSRTNSSDSASVFLSDTSSNETSPRDGIQEATSCLGQIAKPAELDLRAAIDRHFVTLGQLREAFDYIERREQASRLVTEGFTEESVQHALKFVSWAITSKRNDLLSKIVASANTLDDRAAEVTLLRVLRTLEENQVHNLGRGTGSGAQLELQKSIFSHLCRIYSTRGDCPESEKWLRRLDVLSANSADADSDRIAQLLAQSFSNTSNAVQSILRELDLNTEVQEKLPWLKESPAPATHRALYGGHFKAAELLSGPLNCYDQQKDLTGCSVLHVAAETGYLECFRFHGALKLLEQKNNHKMTPLAHACFYGNQSMVSWLLAAGAETNLAISDKHSPLTIACSQGYLNIVRLLLEQREDWRNEHQIPTSAFQAAHRHGNHAICKFILKHGAWSNDPSIECPNSANLEAEENSSPLASGSKAAIYDQNTREGSTDSSPVSAESCSDSPPPLSVFTDSAMPNWDLIACHRLPEPFYSVGPEYLSPPLPGVTDVFGDLGNAAVHV